MFCRVCGIIGIATTFGRAPSLDRDGLERLRDVLAHRGPDGAGFADFGHVLLGHRRLAVIEPTPAGHQPMLSPDGLAGLSYNGELYNDAELRRELEGEGVRVAKASDAATVLGALRQWGESALGRLRGMYALAYFDATNKRLLLARDPLGIKPLYWWKHSHAGGEEVVFASEIPAIAAHPAFTPRADAAVLSSYLTTVRTTLGERTLLADIRTVRPGEAVVLDLGGETIRVSRAAIAWPSPPPSPDVGAIVADSVRRHLRADVPVCCLLSGGLDSSIIASLASEAAGPRLRTYCAGERAHDRFDDFVAAGIVAEAIGADHTEVPITEALFTRRWEEMVRRGGVVLSTPNEVAINEVARRLRRDGMIVALSGEGADELFGGYDSPLSGAAAWHGAHPELARLGEAGLALRAARFELDQCAWTPIAGKPELFQPGVWRGLEGDATLLNTFADEFAASLRAAPADSPLQAHLRFQRRINLTGLLLRLDSATMLEGVEGRTPFADAAVAAMAESLPMNEKFVPGRGPSGTKISLRRSFGARLPAPIAARPKASFPLPFERWIAGRAARLPRSGLMRELFRPEALALVAQRPEAMWRTAWPMTNLAMWAERWWGTR